MVGSVQPEGLIRIVILLDCGCQIKVLALLHTVTVQIDQRAFKLAAQRIQEGVGRILGAVRGCCHAEQQIHRCGGAVDGELLNEFCVADSLLYQVVQTVHTIVCSLIHIIDVDPAYILHQPALADTGVAGEGHCDVLNIQLVEYITGG